MKEHRTQLILRAERHRRHTAARLPRTNGTSNTQLLEDRSIVLSSQTQFTAASTVVSVHARQTLFRCVKRAFGPKTALH